MKQIFKRTLFFLNSFAIPLSTTYSVNMVFYSYPYVIIRTLSLLRWCRNVKLAFPLVFSRVEGLKTSEVDGGGRRRREAAAAAQNLQSLLQSTWTGIRPLWSRRHFSPVLVHFTTKQKQRGWRVNSSSSSSQVKMRVLQKYFLFFPQEKNTCEISFKNATFGKLNLKHEFFKRQI